MKRKHGLLRPAVLRRIVRETCMEWGIKPTRITRKFIADMGGPAAAGLRAEAIQVAAVAVQIVECLDRGEDLSGGAKP